MPYASDSHTRAWHSCVAAHASAPASQSAVQQSGSDSKRNRQLPRVGARARGSCGDAQSAFEACISESFDVMQAHPARHVISWENASARDGLCAAILTGLSCFFRSPGGGVLCKNAMCCSYTVVPHQTSQYMFTSLWSALTQPTQQSCSAKPSILPLEP